MSDIGGIIVLFLLILPIVMALPYLYKGWLKLHNILRYLLFFPVSFLFGAFPAPIIAAFLWRGEEQTNAITNLVNWSDAFIRVVLPYLLMIFLLPKYEKMIPRMIIASLFILSGYVLYSSMFTDSSPDAAIDKVIVSMAACVLSWLLTDKMIEWKNDIKQ